jgi:hypothetical protein
MRANAPGDVGRSPGPSVAPTGLGDPDRRVAGALPAERIDLATCAWPGARREIAQTRLQDALGAVADWLHRTVAGLAPAAPGYRKLLVQASARSRLTSASARHLTLYGEAAVCWRRSEGRFALWVVVPVVTTATAHAPGQEPAEDI